MQDLYIYHVKVQDKIDEKAFNVASPVQVKVVRVDSDATLLAVDADQSGLIGLIRHLHRHGFVLLSIHRER